MQFFKILCIILIFSPIVGHSNEDNYVYLGMPTISPEKLLKQQKINQVVDDKIKQIGSHREKEARSFIEMQEAARNARGIEFFGEINKEIEPENCTFTNESMQPKKFKQYGFEKRLIEESLKRDAKLACFNAGEAVISNFKCSSYRKYVGKPIAINGKLIYKKEDYRNAWECVGSYKCSQPKKVCKPSSDEPARVTRQ